MATVGLTAEQEFSSHDMSEEVERVTHVTSAALGRDTAAC